MYKPKLLLICLLLAYAIGINAQDVKPKFKSLTYVTYETEGTKVIIKDLTEIDGNGKAHFRSIWYNGIADTTYQLAKDKIEQLNGIFDGTHPLKSFMEKTKLEAGHHFGGSFDYVTYTGTNNTTKSLTIVSPFMSKVFNDALQGIIILPSKTKYKGKVISNPALADQIFRSEKRATYLPKIEEPPTVKELKPDK
jgi:hypothetical protein